ncbi:MAG: PilZ domain-containing protein [Candidatus Omnitrophica bacterium]|nr:PilZ domain-containing protein [Candidatus Omnitrophota bacterium]MBU4346842.1 PilZ domain-containing protein [Candidatus Omnitrophota bacterium]MBU4472678.1 PilZ domain-containing protein [Candidatus Omnitrophota bacterium]MCG2706717.1 PilZ domain-containing protein [Candidatus Omnitrophota bacterium]
MSRRYSAKDRRRFQRLELDITVYYQVSEPLNIRVMVGDKEVEATMLDISAGGMGLLTDFDIPARSILLIKFTLAKMDKQGQVNFYGPVNIRGEVRYNVLEDKNRYRLGIRFVKIDRLEQTKITDFVKMTLNP